MNDALRMLAHCATEPINEIKCRLLAKKYNINGYKRIYLVHIRKTGGTSLNKMFLSLSTDNPGAYYKKISNAYSHRVVSNGLIYVGWNVRYINQGYYYYAFSHVPYHQLKLPPDTFIYSCFRDPAKRVISHYNMLKYYAENNIKHPCLRVEGKWLGNNFSDFLENIPKEYLQNQLYMFSKTLDVSEAADSVEKLSYYFFIENFERGVEKLGEMLSLNLEMAHEKKYNWKTNISSEELSRLGAMLEEEYRFFEQIKQHKFNS